MTKRKILTVLLLLLFGYNSWAISKEKVIFATLQEQITGSVTDSSGMPLPGVSVTLENVDVVTGSRTPTGAQTNFDGKYTIKAKKGNLLVFSYVGMKTKKIVVGEKKVIDVVLQEDSKELEAVVLTGSRAPARTLTDSPLPVDIISAKDMLSTGQPTLDKAMQYKIPSFNTVQTPVNDATSLLDPYEIRNLGPSRTLILINGKRKNMSALLYVQQSPGRGETGTDISAIPVDAIKSIQVLRDGASAQYGSDAIAGVVNVILKDDAKYTNVTFRSSVSYRGGEENRLGDDPDGKKFFDGEFFGLSVNSGNPISLKGEKKGFLNYTIDFSKAGIANRAGMVDAEGEADADTGFDAEIKDVEEFLNRKPDAGNINGTPSYVAAKFLLNGALDVNENLNAYFNGAYINKKVNSFANYRTPYWRTLKSYPYLKRFFPADRVPGGYDGYLPGFIGKLDDFNGTLGFKTQKEGWNIDLSATIGGNKQMYDITNTHNGNKVASKANWNDKNKDGKVDEDKKEISFASKYRENSPINVSAGGTSFYNVVGNIDISKNLTKNIGFAFGSEYRYEIFNVIAGDAASYEGGGTDSFAGNAPENSGIFTRNNLGFYMDLSWDIVPSFLINLTGRYENYSDFGDAFVAKLSGRLKLLENKLSLRASVSNGFRAPTLHQIYTQKVQYNFEAGGIQKTGFINNVSPQAKSLGIPKLTSEKSINFTGGLGLKLNKNFSLTLDAYSIIINDRIILSQNIKAEKDGTELDKVLKEANAKSLSFFLNAINTRTSGIDFVVNYKGLDLGPGKLGFNVAGNYTLENKQIGNTKVPKILEGKDVLGRENTRLLFNSRPLMKFIFGADYNIAKFNFQVNNTYFGKTIFEQGGIDENLTTEFTPQILTDLAATYRFNEKITLSLNANNILNLLPTWKFVAKNAKGEALLKDAKEIKKISNMITFNQRYSQTTYNGYHFSQLGMILNVSLNYRF